MKPQAKDAIFQIRNLCVYHSVERKGDELGNASTEMGAALHQFNLDVPRGVRFAILGCSGSGKSTLLSILGSLRTKRSCATLSGVVRFIPRKSASIDILNPPDDGNSYRGDSLGFVLPGNSLLSGFTCLHNLCLPLLRQGVSLTDARARVVKLVEKLESIYDSIRPLKQSKGGSLIEQLNKLPSSVSSGQRQRFAVLRAVVHNPEVVLADEPFSNLDPINHQSMLKLLSQWQEQFDGDFRPTILLVSHHWETAIEWAEHIAFLHEGCLVGQRVLSAEEARRTGAIEGLLEGRLPMEETIA